MKPELINMMLEYFPSILLKGNSNAWTLKCPFHFEPRDRAQFLVDIKGGNYHCIGCGIRGKTKDLEDDLTKFLKKHGNPQPLKVP